MLSSDVKRWAKINRSLAKKTGIYLYRNRNKEVTVEAAVNKLKPPSEKKEELIRILNWASNNKTLAEYTIKEIYKELR